jgi:alpha-glucuronidase
MWWEAKADEIWGQWPGFGGFLVKADSEGNAGPQSYNRTEADGAGNYINDVYTSLLPYHLLYS